MHRNEKWMPCHCLCIRVRAQRRRGDARETTVLRVEVMGVPPTDFIGAPPVPLRYPHLAPWQSHPFSRTKLALLASRFPLPIQDIGQMRKQANAQRGQVKEGSYGIPLLVCYYLTGSLVQCTGQEGGTTLEPVGSKSVSPDGRTGETTRGRPSFVLWCGRRSSCELAREPVLRHAARRRVSPDERVASYT